MRGNEQRKSGVRVENAVDQQSHTTPEIAAAGKEHAAMLKQESKHLMQNYSESLDVVLKNAGLEPHEIAHTKSLFENPMVKHEIITRAAQMGNKEHKLESVLQNVLSKRTEITKELADRAKALQETEKMKKTLSGQRGYWNSQLTLHSTKIGASAEKIKGISERIKKIEKQENELRKQEKELRSKTLDLSLPFRSSFVENSTLTEKDVINAKSNSNDDEEHEFKPDDFDNTPHTSIIPSLLERGYSPQINHTEDESEAEEIPDSAITYLNDRDPNFAATRKVKMIPSSHEAPLVQRDSNVARTENLERRANVAGVELGVKKVGDTYVIEFPSKKMNIEIGPDRNTAEYIFNYAVETAGELKNKKELNLLIDQVSFVALRAKNLKTKRESGFDEFAAFDAHQAAQRSSQEAHASEQPDESMFAREMPIITPELIAKHKKENMGDFGTWIQGGTHPTEQPEEGVLPSTIDFAELRRTAGERTPNDETPLPQIVPQKKSMWSRLFGSSAKDMLKAEIEASKNDPDQLLGTAEQRSTKGLRETTRHMVGFDAAGVTQHSEGSTPFGSRKGISALGEKLRESQAEADAQTTNQAIQEKPSAWSRFKNAFKSSAQKERERILAQPYESTPIRPRTEAEEALNNTEMLRVKGRVYSNSYDTQGTAVEAPGMRMTKNVGDKMRATQAKQDEAASPKAKPSRFENGMPGFGDWAADKTAKDKHQFEVNYNMTRKPGWEMSPESEEVNTTEPTPAEEKFMNDEVMTDLSYEDYNKAWEDPAWSQEMAQSTLNEALQSAGLQSLVKKEQPSLLTLVNEVKNPGFWSTISGKTEKIENALHDFYKQYQTTTKGQFTGKSQNRKQEAEAPNFFRNT